MKLLIDLRSETCVFHHRSSCLIEEAGRLVVALPEGQPNYWSKKFLSGDAGTDKTFPIISFHVHAD